MLEWLCNVPVATESFGLWRALSVLTHAGRALFLLPAIGLSGLTFGGGARLFPPVPAVSDPSERGLAARAALANDSGLCTSQV
jgi:hypothetical protein